MSSDRTEWDDVAEAAARMRNSRCPVDGCDHLFTPRDGAIPVHFSSVTAAKPCLGSWKNICQSCGGLLGTVDGKMTHLATGLRDCRGRAS